MRASFPFSAVVGQDALKLALLLVAVDPRIGGVLITGERGTAKSTAARGIAALLPETLAGKAAPFVELPLGATEDRLVGSLDVGKALQDGRTELREGLLARAHGGVLYVDEVNLLPDHLVDLLLDAAASGWVTVERDGVSARQAAEFVLVGTMNPEEGELRPQFLDRFGLCVQVGSVDQPEQRVAALRQRLRFDDDPSAMLAAAQPMEEAQRAALRAARQRLKQLPIGDQHLETVAALAIERQLAGIRGDLAVLKAARALAALEGAAAIDEAHLRRAAELALVHRTRRRKPGAASRSPAFAAPTELQSAPKSEPTAKAAPAPPPPQAQPELRAAPATPPVKLSLLSEAIDPAQSGRRGAESYAARQIIGSSPFQNGGTLAVPETLRAAALRGARASGSGLPLAAADLRQQERRGAGSSHVLFLVDASGSMATQRRLDAAKGAALGLLTSSYQRRDQVALMVFRGVGADLLLPFTRQVASVEAALHEVPTGGRTPLAGALRCAGGLLQTQQPALLVLFTDGRANVAADGGDPWQEALATAASLRAQCAGALVIDCEPGPILLGRARLLADALGADCLPLDAIDAEGLSLRIQRRMETL